MRVVLDAEADQLLPYTKQIWVVCALDIDSGAVESYRDREALLKDSAQWDTIITHNGLAFDLWALLKVWSIPFTVGPDTFNGKPVQFVDTLVHSRVQWPDRPAHGLEYWGELLKFAKTPWDDFSEYSIEQEAYCINDCLLTAKVFRYLELERNK